MAKMLVHIHSGPEHANKATLGLLVALTASREGHEVTVFLAADGVHLLSPKHRDVEGEGTGRVGDHLEGLGQADTAVLVSGKSAKARGYDETLLAELHADFAMPERLVAEAAAADTVLCY
jgi:predicted peroxiredoxin